VYRTFVAGNFSGLPASWSGYGYECLLWEWTLWRAFACEPVRQVILWE